MLKKLILIATLSVGIISSLISQTQFSATKSGVRKSLIDGYFDSLKFKMPLGLPSYVEDSLKRAGELMTQGDTLKLRNSAGAIDRVSFKGATSGQALVYDGRLFKPSSVVSGSGGFTFSGWFGDSSDGSYTLDGSQGAVANVFSKSGSTYTLLKSCNFNNLTVNVSVILITDGWQLFVSGTLTNNGTIHNNGNAGTNGGNGGNSTANGGGGGGAGSAGTQGAVPNGNFYPSPSAPTSPKAGASAGNGCASSNNTNVTNNGTGVIGVAGGASGVGSRSSLGGGNGSCAGGNVTSSFNALTATNGAYGNLVAHYQWVSFVTTTLVRPQVNGASAGSPGGSGGALSTSKTGGGGGGAGGGGSNGGIVGVYCRILTGNGTITANGGIGGNGGNGGSGENDGAGYSGAGGGGGGGTAGNGGEVDLFTNDMSGWTGTTTANAGTPGTGGAAGTMASNWTAPDGTPSTAGATPAAGKVGYVKIFRI